MVTRSTIELRDLELATTIGTYGPHDVVPDAHLLDLTLTIDPGLVLVDADGMDRVFDYDPLIADLDRLARDRHYATQEFLMSRMAAAIASYPEVEAASLALRKRPVLGGSGSLGVRVDMDAAQLSRMRGKEVAA